jgi:FlaA1/EpsC-like NDP-sugar epimerase
MQTCLYASLSWLSVLWPEVLCCRKHALRDVCLLAAMRVHNRKDRKANGNQQQAASPYLENGVVLVTDAESSIGRKVVSNLLAKGATVRAVSADKQKAQQVLNADTTTGLEVSVFVYCSVQDDGIYVICFENYTAYVCCRHAYCRYICVQIRKKLLNNLKCSYT